MLMQTLLALTLLAGDTEEIKEYNRPEATFAAGGQCYALALSPDGKLLAASVGHRVLIWNTETKKELRPIRHRDGVVVNAIAFSPKGDLLASADYDGVIHVTDTKTLRIKDTIKHDGGIFRLAFSPDGGVLLSGGTADNGDLVLWDVTRGVRQMRVHAVDDLPIRAVAFSPTGKQIATAWGNETVKLWDHEKGKVIHEFSAHQVAFSPNGSKLVLQSLPDDGKPGAFNLESKPSIRLWDIGNGKEIAVTTRMLHSGGRSSICWSLDGNRIAFGDRGQVQVIDLRRPKELIVILGISGDAICLSKDGRYLYGAGKRGPAVTRWDLDGAPQDRTSVTNDKK